MAETEQPHGDGHGAFHLPPPSIWPVILAIGIALTLTGLIINIAIVIAGAVIGIIALAMWVRDARQEFAELPE
jgi:Cytochrome c oxidase subunit IV